MVTDPSLPAAPVELEELLARCVGNMDFAQRVLDQFLSCFGDDIDRLERHFESHEPEELARIAHAMKGAAATVAAHALAHQIAGIEEMARAQRMDHISTRLAEVRDEWSRVSESIVTIGAANRSAHDVTIPQAR
jgi:HPt (histidine-containing phosphotransfer) domain-containing protein